MGDLRKNPSVGEVLVWIFSGITQFCPFEKYTVCLSLIAAQSFSCALSAGKALQGLYQ